MATGHTVIALAGGSFIFLGVIIVFFFAVVYGFYTIKGSGIDKHPNDGLDGAPGSEGPSEASGQGRSTGGSRRRRHLLQPWHRVRRQQSARVGRLEREEAQVIQLVNVSIRPEQRDKWLELII